MKRFNVFIKECNKFNAVFVTNILESDIQQFLSTHNLIITCSRIEPFTADNADGTTLVYPEFEEECDGNFLMAQGKINGFEYKHDCEAIVYIIENTVLFPGELIDIHYL